MKKSKSSLFNSIKDKLRKTEKREREEALEECEFHEKDIKTYLANHCECIKNKIDKINELDAHYNDYEFWDNMLSIVRLIESMISYIYNYRDMVRCDGRVDLEFKTDNKRQEIWDNHYWKEFERIMKIKEDTFEGWKLNKYEWEEIWRIDAIKENEKKEK